MGNLVTTLGAGVLAGSLASAPPAVAAVVSNGGVSFNTENVWDGTAFIPAYRVGVAQSLGGSVVDTSTWFKHTVIDVEGSTLNGLTAVTHNLDEGSDWYLVPANAAFTPATIAARGFTPLVVGNTFYPGTLIGTTFFLAFDTGVGSIPARGQVLGWVRLRLQDGTISLLGSGVAYNEPGIVIGTTTVVPEPATALAALAVTGGLLRRARRA